MRIVVLILAIAGAGASGFLGFKWYSDLSTPEAKASLKVMEILDTDEAKAKVAEAKKLTLASYLLMGGAVLGLIGGVLAFAHKGAIGGLLLVIGGAAPGAFEVKALVFSGVLILAGLLAFLVKKPS